MSAARLTLAEAAELLGVSTQFAGDEIKKKHLRASKIAGKWSVDPEDLQTYIDARANFSRVRRAS